MGFLKRLLGSRKGSTQPQSRQTATPRHTRWRSSRAHLLLLTKFLWPQDVGESADRGYWDEVLGESHRQAVDRFLSEGFLFEAGLKERISSRFRVADMKPLLKARGLKVSGRKAELIDRLVEADQAYMAHAVADVRLLACSDEGRAVAEKYLGDAEQERKQAEQTALAFLKAGDYGRASQAVATYEAEQVFSRGMGIDWNHYDPSHDVARLKLIFGGRPKVLAAVDEQGLSHLRIAAGMLQLWRTGDVDSWLPAGFETGVAYDNRTAAWMLVTNAVYRHELAQLRDLGARSVEYLGRNDGEVCDACRQIQGRLYRLDDAPELPYAGCTSVTGCRCGIALGEWEW